MTRERTPLFLVDIESILGHTDCSFPMTQSADVIENIGNKNYCSDMSNTDELENKTKMYVDFKQMQDLNFLEKCIFQQGFFKGKVGTAQAPAS